MLCGRGCVMSLPVGLLEQVESNLSVGHQRGVGAYSKLKSCSLFCVFHFLYDKTLPEHYYLGPLDLFFLTPMKPEGQLCSGV